MGEVAKLENVLVDNLKAKLKEDIAGMIPDEALETLILESVKNFEQVELPQMIKNELTEQFTKKVATLSKVVLGKYCNKNWVKDQEVAIKSELEKFVEDNLISIYTKTLIAPLAQSMETMAATMQKVCTSCSQPVYAQGPCGNCNTYNY